MRADIVPGGTFPDYELTDHTKTRRTLSELQGIDPMIPYTLVLKPDLVIYSVYDGYWFWGRPSFEDLRRDLREVTREVRPGPGPGRAGPAGGLGRRRPGRLLAVPGA